MRKKGYEVTEHGNTKYYKPKGFKLNEQIGRKTPYTITAINRKNQEVAHGVATGYIEMRKVRTHIYKNEHRWIKFKTRNMKKGYILKS